MQTVNAAHVGSRSLPGGRESTPKPTLDLERELSLQGFDLIIGFDEVGRGALAGPVMVGAAAMWSKDLAGAHVPLGLADSKLLSERRREALCEPLQQWCACSDVGQASNAEIDQWGITHALGIASLRALAGLEDKIEVDADRLSGLKLGAILDGPNDYISKALDTFDAPDLPVSAHVTTRIKADQSCALVSAASVIAKVTRDHLMVSLAHSDPEYAPYAWDRNKGYGSVAHREAIRRLGATDLHRTSWHLV